MHNFKSLFAGFAMMVSLAVCAKTAIGSRELNIAAPSGTRHLLTHLWYPTQATSPMTVEGENQVFQGITVIKDAAPESGRHPLVILSHGYRGSWRNLSWLAAELVQQGYIVAAPDHPGTTTFNVDPAEAARIWERPRDLSRVIDHLLQSSSDIGEIEPSRIAAIGHSLGGWTVMAVGGARFSAEQFLQDCRAGEASPIPCKLSAELGLDQVNSTQLHANLRDLRISAVVALDLGGQEALRQRV
ncbi:alpha/beta hydrolase family protein [Leeia sp.]|uniref:alpha/beta hydrolase family protein n=1 Tax=Leeia sp. TaxID=2884678 RepID=UPI0035B2353F